MRKPKASDVRATIENESIKWAFEELAKRYREAINDAVMARALGQTKQYPQESIDSIGLKLHSLQEVEHELQSIIDNEDFDVIQATEKPILGDLPWLRKKH